MKEKNGKPCHHIGCLNHISHPCEGCGRIGGANASKGNEGLFYKYLTDPVFYNRAKYLMTLCESDIENPKEYLDDLYDICSCLIQAQEKEKNG